MSGKRATLPALDDKRKKLNDQYCLNCGHSADLRGNKVMCAVDPRQVHIKSWCLKWM